MVHAKANSNQKKEEKLTTISFKPDTPHQKKAGQFIPGLKGLGPPFATTLCLELPCNPPSLPPSLPLIPAFVQEQQASSPTAHLVKKRFPCLGRFPLAVTSTRRGSGAGRAMVLSQATHRGVHARGRPGQALLPVDVIVGVVAQVPHRGA